MGQYLSWETATLTFKSGVSIEQAMQLFAELEELCEKARGDGEGNVSIGGRSCGPLYIWIEDLYGHNIYLNEILTKYARLLTNTDPFHGTCEEGDGHFFWRIHDGKYEECDAEIMPSNMWEET